MAINETVVQATVLPCNPRLSKSLRHLTDPSRRPRCESMSWVSSYSTHSQSHICCPVESSFVDFNDSSTLQQNQHPSVLVLDNAEQGPKMGRKWRFVEVEMTVCLHSHGR
jgi:hypothetical protein